MVSAVNVRLLISQQVVFVIEHSRQRSAFFRCYPRSKFLVKETV